MRNSFWSARIQKPFFLLLMLGAVGVLGWYGYQHLVTQQTNRISHEMVIPTTHRVVGHGQREYYSPQYRFSLLYPDFLSVYEYQEGGGAMTISFENVAESKGFQIFIVPYVQEQVTPQRFTQDVPSGVRNEVKEIAFNGARGASFYSVDRLLGETREIWFIKNGYLYEITSLKALSPWLEEVLATWQFK